MNRLAFYVTSAFTSGQLRQYGRRQDIFLQSVNSGEQLMLRLRLEHRCNEHFIFKEINNRHKLHVTLSDDSILMYVMDHILFSVKDSSVSGKQCNIVLILAITIGLRKKIQKNMIS